MRKIALALIFCGIAASQSGADQDEIERFRREYPRAAARMAAHLAQVRGSCRLSVQRGSNPDRYDIDHATFAADHGFRKVSIDQVRMQGKAKTRFETLYCVGPNTAFSLRRPAGAEAYSVMGIGSDRQDGSFFQTVFGRFLNAPYTVNGKPLTEFMAMSTFRLVSAEEVDVAGKRLFRTDYEIGGAANPDKVWIHFDPALGWAIRGGEVQLATLPGAKVTFDIQYSAPIGDLPDPRLVTFIGPDLMKSTCEFDEIVRAPTPANEFTMGFHGLADLARPGVASETGGLVPWLMGLAAVGLIVAFFLRRLALRSTADTGL